MPDIRLQALPQATNLDQALAVGGESIYDLLDRASAICCLRFGKDRVTVASHRVVQVYLAELGRRQLLPDTAN